MNRPQGGRLARLARKELREILRDRRTIATLVLMPLLVYPLLNLTFNRFLVASFDRTAEKTTTWTVSVEPEEHAAELFRLIDEAEGAIDSQSAFEAGAGGGRQPDLLDATRDRVPKIEWVTAAGEKALREMLVDLAIVIRGREDDQFVAELLYRPDSTSSQAARRHFQQLAQKLENARLRAQLHELHELRAAPAAPLIATSRGIRVPDSGPVSIAALIPLILVLMTVTGAVYPAIDLTAGERERGTLEALMATPVSHFKLLLAKYAAVVTVAMLTAVINLLAMTATIFAGGLAPALLGDDGLTIGGAIQLLALLLVFAAFFSAVLLVLTSSARSFKEAQAYLIPLMLLSLGPGIISLIPGIELTPWLAMTPLLNIVLVARDVFAGQLQWGLAGLAMGATGAYTLLALWVAARGFGQDAINAGAPVAAGRGSTDPAPSLAMTLVTQVVTFFCFYSLGGWLGQQTGLDGHTRLIAAGLLTGLIFGGLPLLACRLERLPANRVFRWRPAPAVAYAGALAMGGSLWVLAHQLLAFGESIGIVVLDPQRLEAAQTMLHQWRTLPLATILLCTAVAPALFEELAFRGYLLSALKGRMRPAFAILVTALVFGAFHGVTSGQPSVERILPSTFLGLVLGWTALRCKSLWPGVLLHACSNGLLLTLAYYQDAVSTSPWGRWLEREAQTTTYWLPNSWVVAASCVAGCGALLLWWGTREEQPIARPVTTPSVDGNELQGL